MASAESEIIMGAWRLCRQRSPWAQHWSGGQSAKPPKAESFLAFARPKERQICQFLMILGKWQTSNERTGIVVKEDLEETRWRPIRSWLARKY